MMSTNMYPENDEIDQDQARFLYEQRCAILIVEHLPVGSEIGIDLSSFEIGEKFKGIKLIPPGIHFVFINAIDKFRKQHGPRCGFYHNFRERELLIKRWSTKDEDFDDTYQPSEEEKERYSLNLRELDRFLGAYKFSMYKTYLSLTDKLTPDLLDEIAPKCKLIRTVQYLTRNDGSTGDDSVEFKRTIRQPRRSLTVPNSSKPSENNLLPDLLPARETRIRFTPIPSDHSFSNLSSHAHITQYNLDSTMKLQQTFKGEAGLARLLGEFQFAFVTLVLGHVYECFEQWLQLLILVCRADSALSKHTKFFNDFILTVQAQLDQIPRDLFEDVNNQENLIRHNLDIFFQNVAQIETSNAELSDRVTHLRELLERKFDWLFNLVDQDDEQPVIVE